MKTVESLLTGISGGVPVALVILQSIKQVRDSIDAIKEKLDGFSSRLAKLEVAFDLFYHREIKSLESRIERLESALDKNKDQ